MRVTKIRHLQLPVRCSCGDLYHPFDVLCYTLRTRTCKCMLRSPLLLPLLPLAVAAAPTDHLNLMTANPLRGPNPPELGGPRFLDLSGETGGGAGRQGT